MKQDSDIKLVHNYREKANLMISWIYPISFLNVLNDNLQNWLVLLLTLIIVGL